MFTFILSQRKGGGGEVLMSLNILTIRIILSRSERIGRSTKVGLLKRVFQPRGYQ